MRAKKSDYPELFLGGFMQKRREGKGFFGNSQAKFADMAGAEGGIDMRFKGGGPFAGKGSALRREKRALKRAERRGQLGEDGADRLDYLRSVQKDRAKKAVGAGALAAGAALGGAALAGKLGAKGAGGLFKGGMKDVFKGGAQGGKQGLFNFGAKEGGKRSFMDNFARNLAKRRLQNMGEATDSVEENYGGVDYPSVENGAMVKKYRTGGMIYAEDSDLLQAEKEKNGTAGPRNLRDLFSSLEAVDVPEDYTEQEIVDVRGRNRFVGGEPGSKAFRKFGFALDEDENVAQPMEFRVITERGKRPGGSHAGSGRGFLDFDIENVELGGINEETGDVIPNRITIPADVFDMIEAGEISMNDLTGALSPYYSRSATAGVRTRPQIVRGQDPEEEEDVRKGNPPRNRGRKINFNLPEIRFPQGPQPIRPRYGNNKTRPLFKQGQNRRIGWGS